MTSVNQYRKLLVGLWDTPESDLSIVGAAATKRQATATEWHNYSDQLTGELSTSLNPDIQKGMTADSIREAFAWGLTSHAMWLRRTKLSAEHIRLLTTQ